MRVYRQSALFFAVCLVASVRDVRAASYYVSAVGSDLSPGSAAAPWRTLARVNALRLQPGDTVFLRGGDTFAGSLAFDSTDAGTESQPIVITSYGTGRATIASAAATGIYVHNAAGYRISNIAVVGNGAAVSGIRFFNDLPGAITLAYIRLDSVEVSGYGRDGIEVGSWSGASGYRDVQIVNATAHDNARTGIFVYAQEPNVHRSVTVAGSRVFNNFGIAGTGGNSGSGIILAGVNGGVIARSVAHANGIRCDSPAGPVGIWAYDSTHIDIRHNESYGNRTSGGDGGGFDLDQNVSNSVVEYNYSHDNDGAGYLLAHAPLNDSHYGNVIRYNISQNDGRRNSYGAIEIWGRIRATEIYNNTVFVSPSASGGPRAVRIQNATIADRDVQGVHFRNNVFQTTGGVPIVEVTSGQLAGATDLRFQGNDYFPTGGAFHVLWGGTSYSSLTAWRASGQELIGSTTVGRTVAPLLEGAGTGATLDDASQLETLTAYRLQSGSPLINAGLNLTTMFSLDIGGRDFYGTPIAGTPDVGACEHTASAAGSLDVVMYAKNANAIVGSWLAVSDSTAAGGTRLRNPDAGLARIGQALASPAEYFELTFAADAGRDYRLWVRGKADGNSGLNDSVHVQFSDSVDAAGAAVWRIGTSSATFVNLEDCSGCGLAGWGWQDNGYGAGVLGPLVRFANSGAHRLRIQTREDGFSIDQVVLSASAYLYASPGALRNDFTILPIARASSTAEIVIRASDIPTTGIHGDWVRAADATAANSVALFNPDRGAAKLTSPLAAPASYVDMAFQAPRGIRYHLWLRLRASGNAAGNDSVYVQFSGAVDGSASPLFRIGTTNGTAVILQDFTGAPISGWGWNDNGWASVGVDFYFASTGTQILRLQPREDGVYIDQILLSSVRYLTTAPGALTNDTTVVPR